MRQHARSSGQLLADVLTVNARRLYLLTAAVIAAAISAYSVWRFNSGSNPSPELFRVYGIVSTLLVITWLLAEPRIPTQQKPSFDHGMFVWVTFPFLAAYHMYSARRWRGLLVVLGLLGLIAAPNIALAVAYVVG
jgi:hypothetical protein